MSFTEPLISATNDKYVIGDIQHQDLWELSNQHKRCLWFVEDVDLSMDKWNDLTDNQKHFVKYVLAFFASSDGIVMENLAGRFFNEVQYPEARAFYSFQIAIEQIHNEMYSQLIKTYISDPIERTELFKAMDNIPAIYKKASWAEKWMSSNKTFAERLIAFVCVEGIFFSASFCCIYWLKLVSKKELPGLFTSNDYIVRDEGLHTTFGCVLYKNHIQYKLSKDKVYQIVKEAVAIEHEFVTCALPNSENGLSSLLGMNATDMKQYIEYVADFQLQNLGYPKLFNTRNPFEFMVNLNLHNHSNFFELRSTNYQKNTKNISLSNLQELEEF